MAFPEMKVRDRKVILLSGFTGGLLEATGSNAQIVISDPEKLEAAALRHLDAVAFGYVRGRWVPAV